MGKAMFGSDDGLKSMPIAGPLMMSDAGKDIPPVLEDIANSFKAPPVSLMLLDPSAGAVASPSSVSKPGDVVRSLAAPTANGTPPAQDIPLAPVKPGTTKVDQRVSVDAPFHLTIQGDVQDANQLFQKLRPLLDQHQREFAEQLQSRQLYDSPHI